MPDDRILDTPLLLTLKALECENLVPNVFSDRQSESDIRDGTCRSSGTKSGCQLAIVFVIFIQLSNLGEDLDDCKCPSWHGGTINSRRAASPLMRLVEGEESSGRPRQTSRREDRHMVRNARVQSTASSAAFQAQVAPSLGSHVSSRTIRRRLAEGHLGSWRPLCVLPLTPTHRCLRLEWYRPQGNWTAAEWNQVVFSNEPRFSLSSDDNHVRVWKPREERLNLTFALQ
ncbi:transposable element Tcb2 transposase [Trichonephila clavipes]|nr:transposable element Tcb2 transposase [Trichonephila clavipes]